MKRARVKRVLVLGAEGSRVPLSNAGFDVILPEMGESEYERVDAVFLGWFPDFCLADMTAASKAIWAGARLYVVSNARTYATSKGPALGISGMLAAGLKNTTNKTAKLVGKPSKIAFKYASNLLKVPGENIAVVGDDCTLEPQFAHAGGGIGIGVETGLSTRDQFLNMPEKVRPQLIIRDLTKLLSYLA
jgi:NagD protein